VDNKNLWAAYRPFAELVAGVKLDQEQFRPFDLSTDKVWVFGLAGEEHLLVWVRNRADCWYRVLRDNQEPEVLRGEQIALGTLGVRSGEVTTLWPWREGSGHAALARGVLRLPPFRYGLLARVRR